MIELMLASGIGVLTAGGVWLCLRAAHVRRRARADAASRTRSTCSSSPWAGCASARSRSCARASAPTLANYTDPLPQALVLTAIVISFAMTALLLVLSLKGRFERGDDRVDDSAPPHEPGTKR